MKLLRRILIGIVIVVVVLVAVGAFAVNRWTRGPLPQHAGELTIEGLNDTVEIIRDGWGIPHIYASNSHDLFFAQGYVHAQDRWWQMEFWRAIGDGRIQELTGRNQSVMGQDVFIRTVGWRRAAERDVAEVYDEETLGNMQAFADGVNAYILNRPASDLAMEYNILSLPVVGVSFEIRPWTVEDTVVWQKVMAWDLSDGTVDMTRAEVADHLGDDMYADFEPEWPFGLKPTIIQPEDFPLTEDTLTTARTSVTDTARVPVTNTTLAGNFNPDTAFAFGRGDGIGSNNWVVSGDLTESGMPLLANDPHLGIQMPSIWFEIGLYCQPVSDECPYNVRGFALAAFPGIVIGHNDHIAWGFTNVGPDVNDLYTIEINPENPLQYRWDGEWVDLTVHEEIIRFGDSDETVIIQVREVPGIGPIINDNRLDEDGNPMGFNNDNPMAFRWTALEPDDTMTAIFMMNRATNWEEYRAAASHFNVPSQNLVYADVAGNIGYQTPGRIPIRAPGHNGLFPVDGTTSDMQWLGYIPFDYLPRVLNPERGYIETANQALVPLEYYDWLASELGDEFGEDANYVIDYAWAYGYRGERIVEMLEATDSHTIETFQRIQGDNMNLSARELMPALLEFDYGSDTLNAVRDWLGEWDFQMHMDSPHAAFYAFFWSRLMQNLYNDDLGDTASASGGSQQMWSTFLLMDEPDNRWWDDSTTDATETRDDIIIRSFSEGYDAIVERLGNDRTVWRWGDLHQATFVSNPLGISGIDLIEGMVNRGPVAASGGSAIVNATGWNASGESFNVGGLPSFRMIVDMSDISNSVSIHTTGQSGHPFSEHYGDMIDDWRNLNYRPMLFTREQVEANAAATLTLNPSD